MATAPLGQPHESLRSIALARNAGVLKGTVAADCSRRSGGPSVPEIRGTGFRPLLKLRRTRSGAVVCHKLPDGQRTLSDRQELLEPLIVAGVSFLVRLEFVTDLYVILGSARKIHRLSHGDQSHDECPLGTDLLIDHTKGPRTCDIRY